MVLAQVAHPGPNGEYLVAAAGMLVVAALLYVQKTVAPLVTLVLAVAAVALATGAFVL